MFRYSPDLEAVGKVPNLMEGLVDVLLASPRSIVWFPAILHAAEAVQLLVVHPKNTQSFYQVLHRQHNHIAEGTLDSHVSIIILFMFMLWSA
ncbi:hypothetical protein EON65_20305 [archaeon]|nr:MAG: hypothetical protein EON65_20305 [archaeon]